jgi:hypothetical protein
MSDLPRQLDITGAEMVQVETDHVRKVLYVHVDGYTALRICRIKEILPSLSAPAGCANQAPFTEREWRTIHNGLSTYQNQARLTHEERHNIQLLMNKVRDNYISPKQPTTNQ